MATTFDLVLMNHCVYFMPDAAKALARARARLEPGGHVLVHHQGESCLADAFRTFSRPGGWRPGPGRQNHSMTLETLAEALARAGIPCFVDRRPASVRVDEFFEPTPSPSSMAIVRAMLAFFLDLPVDDWPPERLDRAIAFVRERSALHPPTGHHRFDHPEGLLVVPQADDDPTPPGMRQVDPVGP